MRVGCTANVHRGGIIHDFTAEVNQTLCDVAVAAAEATVGLAIVIAIYRNKKTPLVDEYDSMSK